MCPADGSISFPLQLDVSQLLAKPVIVIQSSDNVTRLLGALLRYGLGCGRALSLPCPCLVPWQGLPWGSVTGVVFHHAKASRG